MIFCLALIRLEDLVAHEQIINIITNLIDSDNLPHLLLYGPPGTGKTSTIVAAAKRMYGPKAYGSMTLELNASDARGIDVSFFLPYWSIHFSSLCYFVVFSLPSHQPCFYVLSRSYGMKSRNLPERNNYSIRVSS